MLKNKSDQTNFRKIISRAIEINFLILACFALLPNFLKALFCATFFIFTFLLLFLERLKFSKLFFINSGLYLLFLLSLFYTDNLDYGLKRLSTGLSLLLFPMAFYAIKLQNRKILLRKKAFLKIFWVSNVLYVLFIFSTFFTYSNPKYLYRDSNFFRNASESLPLIGQHTIYSSMLLAIAIIAGIHLLFKVRKKIVVLLIISGQLIIIFALILLMSRGVFLALLISVTSIFIFRFYKKKSLKSIIYYPMILLVLGLVFFLLPKENNRFKEIFNFSIYDKLDTNNSVSIRLAIYDCVWETIKSAPVLGYGVGDAKDELKLCYVKKSSILVAQEYNSHNQYLGFWLTTGIVGLLFFSMMLIFNLKLYISSFDYLGVSIIILFMVIMFFENILERQNGVLLFSFFINFLSFNSTVEKINNH